MWNNLIAKITMETEAIRRGAGQEYQEMPKRKTAARLFLLVLVILFFLWIYSVMHV